MSQTVFILGAGASQDAGAPLMFGFLDAAEELHRHNDSAPFQDSFDLVLRGVRELQAVHAKSSINDQNLEQVFGAFEMARLIGRLGRLSTEEVDALPRAMRRVIAHTLEKKILFPNRGGHVGATSTYGEFAGMLKRMVQLKAGSVAVISFNYDIALDYALFVRGPGVDYALPGLTPESLPLLKLHGSVNWTLCSCGQMTALRFNDFLKGRLYMVAESEVNLDLSACLAKAVHCGKAVDSEPALVPPTWNKAEYHKQIVAVWARAVKELATAENIFICGYSLPETDEFFRYLLALGMISETIVKRFWIVNRNENRRAAFSGLTGGASRGRFQYFTDTFAKGLGRIPHDLMVKE